MEINVQELGPCEREVTIVVPPDEYHKAFEKEIREAGKSLAIKGFRQGHVPRGMVLQYAGKHIEAHTIESVISEAISKALESKGLEPASEIKLDKPDIKEDKTISLKFSVEVYPPLDPKNYMNVNVEMEPMRQADEKMIDAEIEALLKRWATPVPAGDDEEIQQGFLIVMDFKILRKDKNEVFAESCDVYYNVGSGIFRFEGFDEAVTGLKKGGEKTFETKFPEGLPKGVDAEIAVKIKEVNKRVAPPLDDETVKKFSRHQTIEELRNAIGARINAEFKRQYERAVEEKIMDAIIAENPFEAPKGVVNSLKEKHRARVRDVMLAHMPEEKRGEVNLNFDDEKDSKEAEKSLRVWLLLKGIAKKEGFTVSEKELEDEIEKLAKARGSSVRDMMKDVNPGEIESAMLIDKTVAILRKYAIIKEPAEVQK
ncbi:MAG: trigger factor [Deltaproteobacteria bacterium]|nr:trigger factor [Deltaproteobacteria bacterium]